MNCERCGQPLTPDQVCCHACDTPVALPVPDLPIPRETLKAAADFVGRTWVLDEVELWQAHGAERMLLVTGEPGSGKTALAAWLAGGGPPPGDGPAAATWQRLSQGWSAAHVCVGADLGGSIDPVTFSKSLAAQLARRFPAFARTLRELHDPTTSYTVTQQAGTNMGQMIALNIEAFVVNASNARDTFNRLVRDPLVEVARSCPGLQAWILVDGLDEALDFPAPNIVTLLAGAGDLPEGVRFLLTSRNNPGVLDRLPGARRLNLSDPAYQALNVADLRDYVRRRLSRMGAPAGAEEAIVEAAAGNFLYVTFLLDEIASGRRSPAELGGLPPGLFGLYRGYLHRLVPDGDDLKPDGRWPRTYQPLLGSLSVAIPAAPLDRLPGWTEKRAGEVLPLLQQVQPLTEYDPDPGGYRLFHRSMNDFLATPELAAAGAPDLNPFYTPPADEHARICRYYLDSYGGHWEECDTYGLQRLGAHLRARLMPDLTPAERRRVAEELYSLVLDDDFRTAQFERLGDARASLDDVRLAVEVAVQLGQVSRVLQLAGLYRRITRSSSIARAIFDDVERDNLDRAVQRASFFGIAPRPRGRWAEALQLYLAWEAAVRGETATLQKLFESAERLPSLWSSPLSDALRAHTARILARTDGAGRTAAEWLATLAPGDDPQQLLDRYRTAEPPDPSGREALIQELGRWLEGYRHIVGDQPASEATVWIYTLDADAAFFTSTLTDILTALASEPIGQQGIDDMLAMVIPNAYPHYRDLGLVALASACLAVPDVDWVRVRLQAILAVALDREGVIFALDLPSILEGEAARRGMDAGLPGLQDVRDYLTAAAAGDDQWGTAMRAGSARAAALFWQGRREDAFDELIKASQCDGGFAGFGTLSLLALASRCHEFGDPARARQPIWGREGNVSLLDGAQGIAGRVHADSFRQERLALVDSYLTWMAEDAPDLRALHNKLSTVPDPDVRRAYKDLASARWASPAGRDEVSLAGLIPIVLNDGSTLDALLGRWIGPRLARLPDAELAEAIRQCAAGLLDLRPWELGYSGEAGEALRHLY